MVRVAGRAAVAPAVNTRALEAAARPSLAAWSAACLHACTQLPAASRITVSGRCSAACRGGAPPPPPRAPPPPPPPAASPAPPGCRAPGSNSWPQGWAPCPAPGGGWWAGLGSGVVHAHSHAPEPAPCTRLLPTAPHPSVAPARPPLCPPHLAHAPVDGHLGARLAPPLRHLSQQLQQGVHARQHLLRGGGGGGRGPRAGGGRGRGSAGERFSVSRSC